MHIVHRKLLLITGVVIVLCTSRIYDLADRLEQLDLIHSARDFERTYLTGTTITVLVALIILLGNKGDRRSD